MQALIPIAIFGWIPLTVLFFLFMKPQKATLFSVIGGFLFLPQYFYNFQGFPAIGKCEAIAFGLFLGYLFFRDEKVNSFSVMDMFMLLWCISPLLSSLSNGLGWYGGFSGIFQNLLAWGVFYYMGRRLFTHQSHLKLLCTAMVIGGLCYAPLCLYEIRMSPQLSHIVYGFFPHSFAQHARYDGWRPIVFMQHGLMLGLWMAMCSMVSFWLWRSGLYKKNQTLLGIAPIGTVVLVITTILCKSVGAIFLLLVGLFCFYLYNSRKTTALLVLLVLVVPGYLAGRTSSLLSAEEIGSVAEKVFDETRVESLSARMRQEDLLAERAWERKFFGWGAYGRGRVIDDESESKVRVIDSLWLLTYSAGGLFGLLTLYGGMLIGPFNVFLLYRKKREVIGKEQLYPIMLSLVVVLFMIDELLNGMINPVYIVISGALVSYVQRTKNGLDETP